MASLPVIGWIGAGRMGVPMAGSILKAGYPVVVFSRNADNRRKLVSLGATEARSVAECARAAEVVFSSLPDDRALREVALGPGGVLANAARGCVFADTSTVSTQISEEIDRDAAQRGVALSTHPDLGQRRVCAAGRAHRARVGARAGVGHRQRHRQDVQPGADLPGRGR